MRRSARELVGWSIGAVDGPLGRLDDAYFDDRDWLVAYLVVDTSHWLGGHRVLIPPRSVTSLDPARRLIGVALTRQQVADSPDTALAPPVSRQHELELPRYYDFPSYVVAVGASVTLAVSAPGSPSRRESSADRHRRSVRGISGYYVHSPEGEVGHAVDVVVDDSWTILYLVVSVGTWWPARRVLVPVGWIAEISWAASAVEVRLSAEAIRLAPAYERAATLTPEHEARLERYYGPAPFRRP
jgi:hypothetical protein